MSTVPQEFSWTTARAECSAEQLFKELQIGVENDIQTVNSTPNLGVAEGFGSALTPDGRVYIVTHRSRTGPRVVFLINGDSIEIRNEVTQTKHTAAVVLNKEGRCKLAIKGAEYELWQVRRLALETLFFGSTLSNPQTEEGQP